MPTFDTVPSPSLPFFMSSTLAKFVDDYGCSAMLLFLAKEVSHISSPLHRSVDRYIDAWFVK